MLELLLSLMMSQNISYSVISDNKVQISTMDLRTLQLSPDFQRNQDEICQDITIVVEVDPATSTGSLR